MVKLRQARYCNLKLVLLYLVVYGHWIEPGIDNSEILYAQYWWIYLLHMPLFAFLSGLFLRSLRDCLRQIRRLLPVYGVLQLLIWGFSGGAVNILEPFWHLWYLLSYCVWAGFAWLWFRFCRGRGKLLIFLASLLIAALAGYVPWLERTLSGSRSIVFFPFFWLGLICKQEWDWGKYRLWGLAALAATAVAAVLWGNRIPATFLYHAEPYGSLQNGFGMRLLCLCLSCLMGFFVLTIMPDRRLPCTKAGADTMPGYLLHAPVVGFLREFPMHWVLCAGGTAILLYIVHKIMQWNSPLYGITRGSAGESKRYCGIGLSMIQEGGAECGEISGSL